MASESILVLLFLHNIGIGGVYVYGGPTLFHHREEETAEEEQSLMYLSEDQASELIEFLIYLGAYLDTQRPSTLDRNPHQW